MTPLVISGFGGIAPSMDKRLLPDAAAITASNLELRYKDFRPRKVDGAGTASGVTNPQTIYKFAGGSTFKVHAGDVNYVKGQILEDANERTYYTGDGTPKVTDLTGAIRTLGVPSPQAAPVVTVNVSDELTDEERAEQLGAAEQNIITQMTTTFMSPVDVGAAATYGLYDMTSTFVAGYVGLTALDRTYAARFTGKTFGSGPVLVDGSDNESSTYAWTLDTRLGGQWAQSATTSTRYYRFVTIVAKSYRWVLDSGAGAYLKSLMQEADATKRLMTDAQADELVDLIEAHLAPTEEVNDAAVQLDRTVWQFARLATTDPDSAALSAAVTAFYETPTALAHRIDVEGRFTAVVRDAAKAIYGSYGPVTLNYVTIFDPADNDFVNAASVSTSFLSTQTLYDTTTGTSQAQSGQALIVNSRGEFQFLPEIAFPFITNQLNWLAAQSPDSSPTAPFERLRQALPAIEAAAAQFAADLAVIATWPGYPTAAAVDHSKIANDIAVLKDRAWALYQQVANWTEFKKSTINSLVRVWFGNAVPSSYVAAVTRIIESRIYVATFVTDRGEESQPSDASELVEVDENDTVTLTRPAVPLGWNLTKWRIYRSATGSTQTALAFLDEVDIATTSYTDDKKGEELGELCPTISWAPPPSNNTDLHWRTEAAYLRTDLKGLTGVPNGIMAGFFGNTLCFCEPYTPYAWPVEYQIPVEYPIVGLGVFGQTLFVGTTANPYLVSGADSASMSAIKLEFNQACVSKRSIATVGGGVVYASPDGLCMVDAGGPKVLTTQKFSREAWQALTPSSMFGIEHEGVYYCWYTGSGGGCLTLDIVSGEIGTIDISATAAWVDRVTDSLYFAVGSNIVQAYAGATYRTGTWKSKLFRLPQQRPFAWIKAYGDPGTVTVKIYVEGSDTIWHTATLTDGQPQRLPPGRYQDWQVEISAATRLVAVVLSPDTAGLQGVPV